MARWEPNTRQRLELAALHLYAERGFEQTTVADIAERAGLTKRTFFRYFGDKRDVLFGGSHLLQERVVRAIADAPDGTPMALVGAGLDAAAELLGERRAEAPLRRQVIDGNSELRERELVKLAVLTSAIAEALLDRGVPADTAGLAAEAGVTAFKLAFAAWDCAADLGPLITRTLDDLARVAADR